MEVVLALSAGFFFGASAVAIRWGFLRSPGANADLASLTLVIAGLTVPAGAALATWELGDVDELWSFFALGAVSPAASALFWVRAVQHAGAARASLFLGTTPLWAVLIALSALREPFHVALSIGCLLIVLGTVVLFGERERPQDFVWLGIPLALGAAWLFALRDNGARFVSEDTTVSSPAAATATLLGGVVFLGLFVLVVSWMDRTRFAAPSIPRAFVLAGVCHGTATLLLYEALSRGRITVVEPLTSTSALWGITIAALVLGRREAVGPRLFAAALFVVLGGVLIGAYR